jgi:hypothetical protein
MSGIGLVPAWFLDFQLAALTRATMKIQRKNRRQGSFKRPKWLILRLAAVDPLMEGGR